MKKLTLLILFFSACSICFAQKHQRDATIQIFYSVGSPGIGGLDHRVTIWFENDLIFAQRVCFSVFNNIGKYIGEFTMQVIQQFYQEKGIFLDVESEEFKTQAVLRFYQEYDGLGKLDHDGFRKQAILRHYQENDDYLILDERVEISKSQFGEFMVIISEIKTVELEERVRPDGTIIISTGGSNHYVMKDEDGTTVIMDWFRSYNRNRDIENVLGFRSHMRCPCVEKDIIENSESRSRRR